MSDRNKRATPKLELSNENYEDSYDNIFPERFNLQGQRKNSFDAEQNNNCGSKPKCIGLMHPPSSTANLAQSRLSRLRHNLQKDLLVKQLTPSPPTKKNYDPGTSQDQSNFQSHNADQMEILFGSCNSSPTSSMSPPGKKYVSPLLRDDISYKRRSNDASDEVPNKKILIDPMIAPKVRKPSSSTSSVSSGSLNETTQIKRIRLNRHRFPLDESNKKSSGVPKTHISKTQNKADSFKLNRIRQTTDNQIETNKTRIDQEEIPTDQIVHDLKTRDLSPTKTSFDISKNHITVVKESDPKRRIIKSQSNQLYVKSPSELNSLHNLTKSDSIPSIGSFQSQQSCEALNSSKDDSIDSRSTKDLNSSSEDSEISRQNTNRLKRSGEALSNCVYTLAQNRLNKVQKVVLDTTNCNNDLSKPQNNQRKAFKLNRLGKRGAKTPPDTAVLNADLEDPNREKQKKKDSNKDETKLTGSRSTFFDQLNKDINTLKESRSTCVNQLNKNETKPTESRSIFSDSISKNEAKSTYPQLNMDIHLTESRSTCVDQLNKNETKPTESRLIFSDPISKDQAKSTESSHSNKSENKVSVQSRLTRIKQSPTSASSGVDHKTSPLSGIYETEKSIRYPSNTRNRLTKQQEPNCEIREVSSSDHKKESVKVIPPSINNIKINIDTVKNSRTVLNSSNVPEKFTSPRRTAQSVFRKIGKTTTSVPSVHMRLGRTFKRNIDTEKDQSSYKNNAITEESVKNFNFSLMNSANAEKTQFITSWIKKHHNLPDEIDSGLGQLDDETDDMEWSNAEAETDVLDNQALDVDMDLPMGTDAKSIKSSIISEDNKEENTKEKGRYLCIVVDTNVFISDLMKIRDIIELKVSGPVKPLVYIPWMVITELDEMKDRPGDNSLKNRALNASKCINELLNVKEPRVKGQTVSEMSEQKHIGLSQDDKIIGACLQAVEKYEMVMLLSNDINLRNKAMINGIPAVQSNGIIMKIMSKIAKDTKYPQIMQKLGILCSTIICECVKEAYGDVWLQMSMLAHPPWSFIECLKRFKKYWTAVFKGKLMKQFITTVDRLLELFNFNKDFCDDSDTYQNFVKLSLDLCIFLKDLDDFRVSVSNIINEITKIK
ncbi:unnamed protein product [Diabrotica balteata]|uniref:PIN domain-containing protein n=1 Tax=Diabrotica balteata TaxID=107213 RepID=A0A9N9XHH3_DIABA|nr:unnamed protein product [Diabrotica balteata]